MSIILAVLLTFGVLMEVKPALARRGGDNSQERREDSRRGRGRGQDDFIENQRHREGRRGQHHRMEDRDHRRQRDGDRRLQDGSGKRDGERGRGRDDR
jgi:hypothetical protein